MKNWKKSQAEWVELLQVICCCIKIVTVFHVILIQIDYSGELPVIGFRSNKRQTEDLEFSYMPFALKLPSVIV